MDACRLRRHQSSKSGHPLKLAARGTKNNFNIITEVLREFLKYLRIQDTTSLPKKKSSGAAGGKIIYFGINHVLIIQYASIIIKLEFGRDFVTGNV